MLINISKSPTVHLAFRNTFHNTLLPLTSKKNQERTQRAHSKCAVTNTKQDFETQQAEPERKYKCLHFHHKWESHSICAYWFASPSPAQRCRAGTTMGSKEEGNRGAVCSGKGFRLNTLGWEAGCCAFLTKDLRFKLNLFVLLTFININRSDITCGEPDSPSGAYVDFADCHVVTSLWCERQNKS